jgi:hypothetical protein
MSKSSPNPGKRRKAAQEPNYARIDGALLSACEDAEPGERSLSIFINLLEPISTDQSERLKAMGVSIPTCPSRVLTATLSPQQVCELSHQSWVKSLKLSHRLKPMPND